MILPLSDVETLLQDILVREGINNGNFNIKDGSSKGDGYFSFMTRVTVTSEEKDLNLIIKCAPTLKETREIAPIATAFDREIKFYETIFPAMRQFQEKKPLKDPFTSIVKFYKAVKDENKEVLVLENITAKGFVLKDARIQMDDDHLCLLFKEYAKFHAISYAMKDQQPECYNELTQGMKDVLNPFEVDFFYNILTSAFENLITLFKEEKDICSAVEIFKGNLVAFFKFLEKNKGNYTVVTHGDCWNNNMMFKYTNHANQAKPIEVRLLDFQFLRLGSPILDIAYFFYAGSSKKHLDQLDYYFDMYYEALKEQMSLMGSSADELVPKEKLWEDWKLYCKFGYSMSLLIIKSVLAEADEKVEFGDVAETGLPFETLFNKKSRNQDVINQRLMDLTRHMYENNFLEM